MAGGRFWIADALAEETSVRHWQAGRGVIYSAKVKPSARALASVREGQRFRPLTEVIADIEANVASGDEVPISWATPASHAPGTQRRDK